MEHKRKIITLTATTFLIAIAITIYLNAQTQPTIQETIRESPAPEPDTFNATSLYHWDHMPLTFSIQNEENCEPHERTQIEKAIQAIQDSTNSTVTFQETQEKPDINFYCINVEKEVELTKQCTTIISNETKTNNETWPFEEKILDQNSQTIIEIKKLKIEKENTTYEICYINNSDISFPPQYTKENNVLAEASPVVKGNIITNLSIYIYNKKSRCTAFPSTHVHELLHGFAFAHSTDYTTPKILTEKEYLKNIDPFKDDIMFPYTYCGSQREINQKYINCLNFIYTNGQSPEDCSQVNFLNFEKFTQAN